MIEEKLRLSEARLQHAASAASIGVWDWDVTRNEVVWDDSMYRLYGLRREDFEGAYQAWLRCVHPDDAAQADEEIQAALLCEKEYASEFRIVWPDGSVRYIQVVSQIFRDKEGNPLRMIGTNMDITERKQMEEALRKSEEKYRHIFENSLVAIYRTSPNGKILDANTAFARIVGYASPEEMMNEITNLSEQFYVHPEERVRLAQLLSEQGQVDGFELEIKRKDGQSLWVLSSPRVMRDAAGNLVCYEGAFVDITERKRAEEALRESEQKFKTLVENTPDIIARFDRNL